MEAPSGDAGRFFMSPEGKGNIRFDASNSEKKKNVINIFNRNVATTVANLVAKANRPPDFFNTNSVSYENAIELIAQLAETKYADAE